ncbi:MAG TPA: PEGA domain-containing protein [Bacteroidales bacterium]|nr:PEGA domain-containing protein [Bacteroidales bacterium]HOL98840.1 PEGA domain-containing protein [Bacteroidales bacterium]HOM37060.1 PEGA domain-containing protein [Bacteroidales bacterium]HPD24685.1 PEGA domain-containing protein [Bacteroidales bacterium]HRT00430.1 PEGA domain-containing protein [Bacteroidales bacterium]
MKSSVRNIVVIISFLFANELLGQQFKIITFEEDPNDLSALVNPRYNVNDEKCALIKVYTNLDALFFETRLGVEGDIVEKKSEYWIYVSPKEKMLKFIKKGYIPHEYFFPVIIKPATVYKLVLTGDGINFPENENVTSEFVVFESEPSGASVFINDKYRGATPLTIPLFCGKYICKFEKPQYKTRELEIIVKAGETLIVNEKLEELDIYGNISVSSNSFAEIFIDKVPVGKGKFSSKIIEGLHIIEIKADGYKPFYKEIYVVVGKNYTISQQLEPLTGVISVQSKPYGASIFIDGEFYGTTPKFIRNIPVGQRLLTLELENYVTVSDSVLVEYDKSKEFFYELKPGRKFKLTTTPSNASVYVNNVLIGNTPIEFYLDYSKQNRIRIIKEGYHIVFDEIPPMSQLSEKFYKLERKSKGIVINKTINLNKLKSKDYLKKRTVLGFGISGFSKSPGGIGANAYMNFDEKKKWGFYANIGYQNNLYSNFYLNEQNVDFFRYSAGLNYNIWLRSFAVIELFAGLGQEYASELLWNPNFTQAYYYYPDLIYSNFINLGSRLGIRIIKNIEIFGGVNYFDFMGSLYDKMNIPVSIGINTPSYKDLFPDRNGINYEVGIRLVFY